MKAVAAVALFAGADALQLNPQLRPAVAPRAAAPAQMQFDFQKRWDIPSVNVCSARLL